MPLIRNTIVLVLSVQSAVYSLAAAWREFFLWFDMEAEEDWKYYPEKPSWRDYFIGKRPEEKAVLTKNFAAEASFKCVTLMILYFFTS